MKVIEDLVGPLRFDDEWRVCFRRHNRCSNNVDWMLRSFYYAAADWGRQYPAIGRAMLEDLRCYDPTRGGLPACGGPIHVAKFGSDYGESWLDDPGVQSYLQTKGITAEPRKDGHLTQ